MMSGEAWLFLLAVLINAVNLFLQVFFTIMYSDLEWYVLLPSVLPGLPLQFLNGCTATYFLGIRRGGGYDKNVVLSWRNTLTRISLSQ